MHSVCMIGQMSTLLFLLQIFISCSACSFPFYNVDFSSGYGYKGKFAIVGSVLIVFLNFSSFSLFRILLRIYLISSASLFHYPSFSEAVKYMSTTLLTSPIRILFSCSSICCTFRIFFNIQYFYNIQCFIQFPNLIHFSLAEEWLEMMSLGYLT